MAITTTMKSNSKFSSLLHWSALTSAAEAVDIPARKAAFDLKLMAVNSLRISVESGRPLAAPHAFKNLARTGLYRYKLSKSAMLHDWPSLNASMRSMMWGFTSAHTGAFVARVPMISRSGCRTLSPACFP
eukprot:scaffold19892_cov44-Prasinocladus_malaysianus.AAC.2